MPGRAVERSTTSLSTQPASPSYNPIENHIAPSNLLGLVRNTAPFLEQEMAGHPLPPGARLIELGEHPRAFLAILQGAESIESGSLDEQAQLEDYFAYCMACHHATVATYVPTDVDSKIRGLLWRQNRDREPARRMFDFTTRALRWSIAGISKRATELAGVGPVSGHNGEQLSVLAGALGHFLKRGDTEYAEKAAAAIDAELWREATEFRCAVERRGAELDVLRLSASLTHNVGDLDQGISFWSTQPTHAAARERFGRLAHENTLPYGGTFAHAARIYKKAMSPEGHRNYPLRGVKPLRRSADLLLPLGPFFDEWGSTVAIHPALNWEDRAEVLAALIHGCRTIPNQRGYYRAIHGLTDSLGGSLERVVRLMPAKSRAEFKDAELRKQVAVARISFESMMKKLAV
ncbi:MAG: hypothetical protein HY820_30820 [Acidobacteria bacterium]|nr:hypothetical protein [Acidobacteriota bacterium]